MLECWIAVHLKRHGGFADAWLYPHGEPTEEGIIEEVQEEGGEWGEEDHVEIRGPFELVTCTEHEWTGIAPEIGDNGETLEWCIRCGRLKLCGEIFSPGPHQTTTCDHVDAPEES